MPWIFTCIQLSNDIQTASSRTCLSPRCSLALHSTKALQLMPKNRCWKEKLSHSSDIEKSRQGTTNAVPFRQVRTKIFTKSCGTFPLADWFNLELKWPVIQTQPSLECFCRNTQGEVEWTSVRPLTTKFDVFWSVNACWDEGKKRIIKCKETMNSKLYKTAGT